MRLAFNSMACPDWNLTTIIDKAREYGFTGIELAGRAGLAHLHAAPDLSRDPARVAAQLKDAGIELACLATSATFCSKNPETRTANQADVKEHIRLAARLGCPFVRVLAGKIPAGYPRILRADRREAVLDRIATAIRELVPLAAEHGVAILIENDGDFSDSASLWHIIEAVSSPMVRGCWNPLAARVTHERPTTSIPRLGSKTAMVRICDAVLDENDRFRDFTLPGHGATEIRRTVQLLRGTGYRGYMVFAWPRSTRPDLAGPEVVLPAAASFLKSLLDEQPVVLAAYKGDKFRPRQGPEFTVNR